MDQLLGIYLNDQLALGLTWRELARRAARNNRGMAFEAPLAEVAADVETFRGIMNSLRVRANPVNTGLALLGERLARSKPNGRLVSYSPLSRPNNARSWNFCAGKRRAGTTRYFAERGSAVLSMSRTPIPIIPSARPRWSQLSAWLSGTKFAVESWSTTKP